MQKLWNAIPAGRPALRHAYPAVIFVCLLPMRRSHSAVRTRTAVTMKIKAPSASTVGSVYGNRTCVHMKTGNVT